MNGTAPPYHLTGLWWNLHEAAIEAHRALLGDTVQAQAVRGELAARDIDIDDIRTWGLGCAMADNRVRGVYRGQHLACSWPMLNPAGNAVTALAWRRTRWAERNLPAEHQPVKYAYETGSRPGESLFGLDRLDSPAHAVMPEGWPCVVALDKAGIPAASPIGVTITAEQARLAARACPSWVIVFDNDPDGPKLAQAQAVGRQLERYGAEVRITFMETVKDPSENIAEAEAVVTAALRRQPAKLPKPPMTVKRRWHHDDIAEVAAHHDLIDLVGRTVTLYGLRGDCPFHGSMGEGASIQSLALYETDEGDWRWHCFSGDCGGGTAVEWVARRDGITLDEAMARMAGTAQIAPPAKKIRGRGGPAQPFGRPYRRQLN